MAQRATTALHELFAEWGPDQPTRLVDLMNADYDTLNPLARSLRQMSVELVHSFEREPVYTAGHARKMLERHHLPARRDKWCIIALDAERERIYVKAEGGGMRLNHTVSSKCPEKEKIAKRAPLPVDGKYLIIYGGSPDILGIDGTAEALRRLQKETSIADVIFWETNESAATFYSLQVGKGQRGSEIVEFPDPALLEKARNT